MAVMSHGYKLWRNSKISDFSGFSGNSLFMSLFVIYHVLAAESMLRWASHLHPEVSVETVSRSVVSTVETVSTAGTRRQNRSSAGAMD